jgi:hypothetical protein
MLSPITRQTIVASIAIDIKINIKKVVADVVWHGSVR